MSSVGVFHKGEIDGKQYHIYTLLSQTASFSSFGATTISDGDDLSPPEPLFLCPSFRVKVEWLKREVNDSYEDGLLPFKVPPHFPSADQHVQYLLDESESFSNICKLPLAPLFWCTNKLDYIKTSLNCSACESPEMGTDYYFCVTCDSHFHKECVESPLEIKHPSYPFLSLQLYNPPQYEICFRCERPLKNMVYHCPTYQLSLHQVCAMKPIVIVIDHPERHPHPLKFFPKQNALTCNVCGLIKNLIPTYVCVDCVLVVHEDCLYFPYVIRICRHHHRISFTSSIPSGNWSCGVCRKKIDTDWGAYSCNKCLDYFVHSRCALRKDLWDGKELKGVPEEPEVVVEPFETIAGGIILHFSHGHHLKLEITRVYDDDKFCQACILPVYEGSYYSCVDDSCDFILHEACANAPRRKHHPLYAHPLTLKVVTNEYNHGYGHFNCDACQRPS